MNEQSLESALWEASRRTAGLKPSRALRPPGCLRFGEVRSLALHPGGATSEEERHLAACRRCARMLTDFDREMPHLPVWTLLRRHLGTLVGDERLTVAYHLDEGGCRECARRAVLLERGLGAIVHHSGPIRLPHPGVAAAAVAMPDTLSRAVHGTLDAELFEEAGEVRLEIRTKDPGLHLRVVGFCLRGEGPATQKEGYAVLQEDMDGWYTAQLAFRPAELHAELGGRCEELLLAPVDPDLLTREERESVLRDVGKSLRDAHLRHGWSAWVEATVREGVHEELSEETWELVCAVRERLQR